MGVGDKSVDWLREMLWVLEGGEEMERRKIKRGGRGDGSEEEVKIMMVGRGRKRVDNRTGGELEGEKERLERERD